jgi:glycosyltransferase involved in cell wall biosynthesis
MNIVFMHQTIVMADAIGHDILEMYCTLEKRGHRCYLCCEYLVDIDSCARLDFRDAGRFLDDPRTVIIYHHSNYWPAGEELLAGARARIVFKYHNITPPTYFAAVPEYARKCLAGREQTYRFTYRLPSALWLTDSLFNLRELGIDGVVDYRVVPPFLHIREDGAVLPDNGILKQLISAAGMVQALFVGRFAPNKGHLFLVHVLEDYRRLYGEGLRLFVIGKHDPAFSSYYDAIGDAVERRGVQTMFCDMGEVPAPQMLAYFLGCDAYLCCSEHEGFCVPVVESQCFCLPVVAKATTAVPETIGSGQILLADDPEAYAHSLFRLTTDKKHQEQVIAAGRQNYLTRFTHSRIEQTFLAALYEYLGPEL